MAVPEGASRLASWCSSMISTPSMCGAAIRQKCSSSTAPMAKLARHDGVGAAPAEARRHVGQVGVGQPAGPDDGVDPLLGVVGHVVAHRLGDGEVDHDLGPEVAERVDLADDGPAAGVRADVAGVDGGDQLHVGRLGDRAADLLAHAAAGADHTDLLHGQQATGRPGREGGTRSPVRRRVRPRSACGAPAPAPPPPPGPPPARPASMRASTSSTESTSPCSSIDAPMRLMRAPESSPESSISARRLPLATANSRSVTPSAASSSSSASTICSTSSTCSGAVPTTTASDPRP